jgi:hypothetical protein
MERMPPRKASAWECGRCYWLQHQQTSSEVAEHSPRCSWYNTERDPPVLRLIEDKKSA